MMQKEECPNSFNADHAMHLRVSSLVNLSPDILQQTRPEVRKSCLLGVVATFYAVVEPYTCHPLATIEQHGSEGSLPSQLN